MDIMLDLLPKLKELENKYWLFMHRTSLDAVKSIFIEGFKYEDHFHNTSDLVITESDYLNFRLNSRKRYGDYVVLIAINKEVIHFGNSLNSEKGFNSLNVDLLADSIDEEDFENVLSTNFVYGAFNIVEESWLLNPLFDLENIAV